MTDTEFRQAVMTLLLKPDTDLKAKTQEEMNEIVINDLRKRIRKYKKIWDMLFRS